MGEVKNRAAQSWLFLLGGTSQTSINHATSTTKGRHYPSASVSRVPASLPKPSTPSTALRIRRWRKLSVSKQRVLHDTTCLRTTVSRGGARLRAVDAAGIACTWEGDQQLPLWHVLRAGLHRHAYHTQLLRSERNPKAVESLLGTLLAESHLRASDGGVVDFHSRWPSANCATCNKDRSVTTTELRSGWCVEC